MGKTTKQKLKCILYLSTSHITYACTTLSALMNIEKLTNHFFKGKNQCTKNHGFDPWAPVSFWGLSWSSGQRQEVGRQRYPNDSTERTWQAVSCRFPNISCLKGSKSLKSIFPNIERPKLQHPMIFVGCLTENCPNVIYGLSSFSHIFPIQNMYFSHFSSSFSISSQISTRLRLPHPRRPRWRWRCRLPALLPNARSSRRRRNPRRGAKRGVDLVCVCDSVWIMWTIRDHITMVHHYSSWNLWLVYVNVMFFIWTYHGYIYIYMWIIMGIYIYIYNQEYMIYIYIYTYMWCG